MVEDQQEDVINKICFKPNQKCLAIDDFTAMQDGDLSFIAGDRLTILRESEMMYWYVARNKAGEIGTVPGNYICSEPLDAVSSKADRPNDLCNLSAIFDEDYQEMSPGITPPVIPPKPEVVKKKTVKKHVLSETEKQMLALLERDKAKRLAKGTLVVATASYNSKSKGDLHFTLHDEMMIIEPTKDLCWYRAYKVDAPSQSGIIPLTHVRLVYMSDEEDEIPEAPTEDYHDRVYENKDDFLNNSGWFTYPGFTTGTEANLRVLARKVEMSFEDFMSIKSAIYLLEYMKEKKFIGMATVLHEELVCHFNCFGKQRKDIREVDDDLCHHTFASGWKMVIWPMDDDAELEVEFAKKVIEHKSLMSPLDGGMNESMKFSSIGSFERFWDWFSPN